MKKGEALHLCYRPQTFEEYIGSEAVKESILSSLHRTHTFLFFGPRGTGKTTMARLVAYELGAKGRDIIEVDAADRTGVDDTRQLKSTVGYSSLMGGNKVYIIDEVHRLSLQAMDSLLKTLEEPPEHVYFVLCTTEVNKVVKTIRSRAKEYELKPLSKVNSEALIDWICEQEGIEIPGRIKKVIINRCEGIPREIVISLDKVRGIKDIEEAKELIQPVGERAEIIELCRLINKGGTWRAVAEILVNLEDDPEQVRRAICKYMGKVLLNSDKSKAKRVADIIFLFSGNFYDGGKAELAAYCYTATQM